MTRSRDLANLADGTEFSASDHSKLDGIEASATADQTSAQIKAAVEAATDSNVFTDADHSKLNAVEASADVTDATNVTAAGALMDSELTNLAAVKAINQSLVTTAAPTFAGLATTANVGIGTDSAACALHIDAPDNGAIVAIFDTDNSGSKLIFRNNSTTGNNTQIGAEGNDLVAFTGGVAHMRIASNGAATIGPATYGGSGYSVGLQLRYAGGGAQYGIDFLPDADGANACDFFNAAGSLVGYIALGATSTAYVTSSDYRLKTDAQPMVGASARVQALNPVNFEWLSDGTRVDGFLAHEAQAIVPEAVTGTKDAMMDQEYEVTPAVIDENGTTTTEAVMGTRSVPDYQGIDQSKIVPLLTAALQEALTKIDDMETRLAALEA
jgi:hypothetical protein